MPKTLPVRILKTSATRAVCGITCYDGFCFNKKGRQLSVRTALPNSVNQSAKFVIFPAYPSPRLNLFRLDDISDSFTDSRAAAIAARSFALIFLLIHVFRQRSRWRAWCATIRSDRHLLTERYRSGSVSAPYPERTAGMAFRTPAMERSTHQ